MRALLIGLKTDSLADPSENGANNTTKILIFSAMHSLERRWGVNISMKLIHDST
jgi:hypothetical protein